MKKMRGFKPLFHVSENRRTKTDAVGEKHLMLKKWVWILMFAVCLLACSAALADRSISISADGQSIGSISVPDNVTVILEKNGIDGIRADGGGNGKLKTLTLNDYDINPGEFATLDQAKPGQKVVAFDLEYRSMQKDPTKPAVYIPIPVFHTGTVKEVSGNLLVITSFELENPNYTGTGNLISEGDWNTYLSYISDEDIDYTFAPNTNKQNINWHIVKSAYTVDVNGYSGLEFRLRHKRHTWYIHYTLDVDYILRIDNFSITSHTGEFNLKLPLEEVGIPGSLFLKVDGEGGIGYSFEKDVGFSFEFNVGFKSVDPHFDKRDKLTDPELYGEMDISAEVGLAIGPEIPLDIIDVGIVYEMGIDFTFTVFEGHYFLEDKEHNKWHACNECYQFDIFPQTGPLALEITIVHVFSEEVTLIKPTKYPSIYTHHWSKTYKNEEGDGPCPLIAYRLDVTVKDEKDRTIRDAEVSYPSEDYRFFPMSIAKTNPQGEGRIYIPLAGNKDPNRVTVTATVPSPKDPSVNLTGSVEVTENGIPEGEEEPDPSEATITINMQSHALEFRDTGSGEASNMPATVYFYTSQGKVRIPDEIPDKPGLLFKGWNTKADGTGDNVAPGAQVAFKDDAVLYAQWQLLTQNYVVEFNACGGSYASPGEVVPIGQSVDISNKYAVWEHHNFLGWAYDEAAAEPDFPAGQLNVLSNPQELPVIELYALWSFNPVNPPIRIHFDMNGGPQDRAPMDKWIDPGSWLTIPVRPVIRWDEVHVFQGWSEDPNATSPTYAVGQSYRFTESTTLYAVWKLLPVCTLSFADAAGGDPANMPEPILFVPSVSPRVSVPDTIPTKSGRHFTGWNTAPDGTGRSIQPGAVIVIYGDTVLYAQWEVIGERWMVIFNANGGTTAPMPQFAKSGEAMMLTTAEAVWSDHKFLGWSRRDDADLPDYPVGESNVIPYDKDHTVLMLYAVWGFSPVDMPVHITYDMNGGGDSQKPSGQWIPPGSWMKISDTVPTWDGQHTFLGWSVSGSSKTAEYKPGENARFDKDTVLYAVWKIAYTITEGNGSEWQQKSEKGLKFVADGNIQYFSTLLIDGHPLDSSMYTLESGSTVVTLKPDYLENLASGRHTIRFAYKDGNADGYFTVTEAPPTPTPTPTATPSPTPTPKPVPKTGDSSNPALWIALMILGLLCMGGIAFGAAVRKK